MWTLVSLKECPFSFPKCFNPTHTFVSVNLNGSHDKLGNLTLLSLLTSKPWLIWSPGNLCPNLRCNREPLSTLHTTIQVSAGCIDPTCSDISPEVHIRFCGRLRCRFKRSFWLHCIRVIYHLFSELKKPKRWEVTHLHNIKLSRLPWSGWLNAYTNITMMNRATIGLWSCRGVGGVHPATCDCSSLICYTCFLIINLKNCFLCFCFFFLILLEICFLVIPSGCEYQIKERGVVVMVHSATNNENWYEGEKTPDLIWPYSYHWAQASEFSCEVERGRFCKVWGSRTSGPCGRVESEELFGRHERRNWRPEYQRSWSGNGQEERMQRRMQLLFIDVMYPWSDRHGSNHGN